MKLCKDCAFYNTYLGIDSRYRYHYCRHPDATAPKYAENVIIGRYEVQPELLSQQCAWQRADGAPCGPEAKNWKAAPPRFR